jgi:hypothetical protein
LGKFKPYVLIIKEPVQYLILGLGIYIFFRSGQVYFNKWLLNQNLGFDLHWIRSFTLQICEFLPDWFLFSLPDALWMFSLSTLIHDIWKNEPKVNLLFWSMITPIIAVTWEIAQGLKFISGTFDWVDILFYLIVTAIINFKLKTNKYEKTS